MRFNLPTRPLGYAEDTLNFKPDTYAVLYVQICPPGQRYPVGMRTYQAADERELKDILHKVTKGNGAASTKALGELKRRGQAHSARYGFMVQYARFRPSGLSR